MSRVVFENDALAATVGEDFVATIELSNPPNNFFSLDQIGGVADALELLDQHDECRAAVLCAAGKHFCAGADFSGRNRTYTTDDLYAAAVRIFRTHTPVVAAVQGAAIGGGLGLALSADFRIAAPEARFSANFARLGFHHGFGLSVTLPRLVGQQNAAELLYTGRRVKGDEAVELGLADRLAGLDSLRDTAHDLAREIAVSAPVAVRSIRATLRGDLADRVEAATAHEADEQERLRRTADFAEGNAAMSERRQPDFTGT
jgi:2-(1,2-epoxy-1,2-dihydrophenyl)acetyl-CoA isomerase